MAPFINSVGLSLLAVISVTKAQSKWRRTAPRTNTVSSEVPPSSFERRENLILPYGVSSSLDVRLHTNKFYSQMLFETPSRSAWTLPYIVTINEEYPFGLSVSHPEFYEGSIADDGRVEWYANRADKDVTLSATELHTNQLAEVTSVDSEGLSVTVHFTSEDLDEGSMTTYLVRGMAYATVEYESFIPEVSTQHSILTVNGDATAVNHTSDDGRFMLELQDGSTWILYCDTDLELTYSPAEPNEPDTLRAAEATSGVLRVTRVPYSAGSANYDEAIDLLDEYSGRYVTSATLRAWRHITNTSRGRYKFIWSTTGSGSSLLHYALPHHQALLKSSQRTGLYMRSPTKGDMELVTGTSWTMTENSLPEFGWVSPASTITESLEMDWIEFYLEREISQPLVNVAGASVYFGAKNMMAYAQMCLVADEIGRDDLVEFCVDQVEASFDDYIQHNNGNPLVFDTTWGGIIGALGLDEDNRAADFYAAYYNDHHFHYSYLVNVGAVLAYLRPSWATDTNKEWVEMLIRDVNNPNKGDDNVPYFRSFDWFCGHSWARGLLYSADGKDQARQALDGASESSSEDVNFFYAMTMWAIATDNIKLEGLGRLQTGMVSRSINEYFLLKDDNTNHPADFVIGIFFEAKVDYTTWFGNNVEYIHGIQNIPVTFVTEYVRDAQLVSEEWDQRLEGIVDEATGIWKTVLYMSYATIQKHIAFEAMLSSGVDFGLKRSWALYWAATRPTCSTYCIHDEVTLLPTPAPTPAPVVPSGPWGGTPAVIPGTIQAEEYDLGGEGVGYSDSDAGNIGGAFRTDEAVDISTTSDGGYYVGWNNAGEYLRYTVDVDQALDPFAFSFEVAAPASSGQLQIVASGTDCDNYDTDLSGVVTVPSTGGWNVFESLDIDGVGGLPVGETTITLCIITSGFNIASFTMRAKGDPYGGTAAVIPGIVEAEEYDTGGEGVGYSDTDVGNNGGGLRDDDVDILTSSTGYYVGWIRAEEYLRYTVEVDPNLESYEIILRVAAPSGLSGQLRLVANGSGCNNYDLDLSGIVPITSTGGWSSFEDLVIDGMGSLSEGSATIWLCVLSAGFNIDSFTIVST
ncbi:unnamed protein product [Ascophyllum nodosum]